MSSPPGPSTAVISLRLSDLAASTSAAAAEAGDLNARCFGSSAQAEAFMSGDDNDRMANERTVSGARRHLVSLGMVLPPSPAAAAASAAPTPSASAASTASEAT